MDVKTYIKREYCKDIFNVSKEDREKLETCTHNRDERSLEEFKQEVMLGWIIEDYVKGLLSNGSYLTIANNGTDANRNFTYNYNIQNKADLLLFNSLTGQKIELEVVVDYSGFWKKSSKMHLRDNKFKNLLEEGKVTDGQAKNKNVWIFGIDIQNKQFYIINVNKDLKVKKIESHLGFGGKPATEIDLDSKNCCVFSIEEFLKHIECNNRKYNKKKVA